MTKQITTEFLQSINACQEGIDCVGKYENKEPIAVIKRLVADDHWDWANWLLPRLMDYKGYVDYACFAAELVLPIYERQCPEDNRPRKAIKAARKCIDDPSDNNKRAAAAAVWATAAEEAAWAAAWAAAAAAWAAAAAEEAAWAAVRNAAMADKAIKTKIINHGIEILEKKL